MAYSGPAQARMRCDKAAGSHCGPALDSCSASDPGVPCCCKNSECRSARWGIPMAAPAHSPLPTSKPTSLQGAQGPTKMPIKISVLATVVRQQARREGSFGSWPAVGQRCLLLVGPLSMRAGLAEQPSAHEDCRTAKCPCSERHQEAVLVGPLPQDAAALQPGGRDHPFAHLARRQHLRTRGGRRGVVSVR